jgi:hypothetical protein
VTEPQENANEPAEVQEDPAAVLAREWPVGQLVELVASEFKGWQGRVSGHETKPPAKTPYVQVTLERGKRRNVLATPKVMTVRSTSLASINQYTEPTLAEALKTAEQEKSTQPAEPETATAE